MSDLTDYAEEQFMNWSFLGTAMDAAPSNVHIALHTGDPGETGANNEVSAGDYSRTSVTAGTGEFTLDTSGTGATVTNDNELTFGVATSSWGTVSHFSIWDSGTDGNCLWYSALDSSKTVESNDELRFQAGDLSATID